MDRRVVLVGFNGDPMCFVHVLLNALDMKDRGFDVRVVIEGSATRRADELNDESVPLAGLYARARDHGLIDCVCHA